jgi:hypothetical protein
MTTLSLEEQERQAYSNGQTHLAEALGACIDLENELNEARHALRESLDFITDDDLTKRIETLLEREQ